MRYERWRLTNILWAPRPVLLGKLEFAGMPKAPLLGELLKPCEAEGCTPPTSLTLGHLPALER